MKMTQNLMKKWTSPKLQQEKWFRTILFSPLGSLPLSYTYFGFLWIQSCRTWVLSHLSNMLGEAMFYGTGELTFMKFRRMSMVFKWYCIWKHVEYHYQLNNEVRRMSQNLSAWVALGIGTPKYLSRVMLLVSKWQSRLMESWRGFRNGACNIRQHQIGMKREGMIENEMSVKLIP